MSVRAALARPAFRSLLVGQVVSIVGDRLNYLALVALLSAHAASASASGGADAGSDRSGLLAALAWAMLGPSLVVSPWAGALVDRWPLVRTLVVTDLVRAFVVAAIPLAYLASGGALAPVFTLVAVAYVLNAFFLPARSALPPHLVAPSALAAGNAVLVLGGVVATLVGTTIGGPVVDRWGPPVALWVDAATYLVSVVALATILRGGIAAAPPAPALEAAAPDLLRSKLGVGAALSRAVADVREGWRLALATPSARGPLVASISTWIAGGVLHVSGTTHVQRGSVAVTNLGLLLGALAVGALAGTAYVLRRERTNPIDRRSALAIGLVGAGLGLIAFAAARSFGLMALAGFVVGLCAAPVLFLAETALQEAVAPGARARLFAARDFLSRGAFLVTAAVAAPAARAWGDTAVIGGGATLLVLLGLGAVAGRRSRRAATD